MQYYSVLLNKQGYVVLFCAIKQGYIISFWTIKQGYIISCWTIKQGYIVLFWTIKFFKYIFDYGVLYSNAQCGP